MEKALNHFYGGLNTDKHVEMRDDTCTLQNELFRVMDVKGHGLVDSNLMGNDYDDTVGQERGFKLSDGFVPLGETTFKGITFIFSHNPGNDKFEIGTFPSPNYNGSAGFTAKYKPLYNYLVAENPLSYQQANPLDDAAYQAAILSKRNNFTITSCSAYPWNITAGTMQIVSRMNYDNSVNLYFADGNNPMRVINCGFDVFTGLFTKHAYCDTMFKHAIQVLNESDAPVRLYDDGTIKQVEIGYSGQFKCGNVQFYFRYSDEDFNPTSFLSHSGMVSIIPSNEQASTNPHSFMGGPGDKRTNKSVKLFIDLKNSTNTFIDVNYKYLEIAYVRHYEQGAMESFRIGKRWEIWDLISKATALGQNYIEIEITDFEQKISVTTAEIIKSKRKDCIALDLTTIEDRLWAGNMKVADYDFKTLYDFSQTIEVEPIKEILDDTPAPTIGTTFAQVGYKNYQNVYHYAQYLAGETYCFGVQYLLRTTGKWSESFPIKGDDWYSGSASGVAPGLNTKGILRFPAMSASPVLVDTDKFNINGVQFIVPATSSLLTHVTAMRFTRVERKKNLLYQGVICKAFCSHSDPYWGRYANCQDFVIPNLWQHYPYAYSLLDDAITGAFPKTPDGKAFAFFSNTRSWPSPFTFSPALSIVNQGSTFPSGNVDVDNWKDPYTYPVNTLAWLRCDIPWKLFMNSKEANANSWTTGNERNSLLHWFKGYLGSGSDPVDTPGYAGTTFLTLNLWGGKEYIGTSYKGDRTAWHKGPAHIIPGWNKGLWGIYSLDFAIKSDLKETSYFIKKIGEANGSFINTKNPTNANKIYSFAYTPEDSEKGSDLAAVNDLLKDFEHWLTDPTGWTIPFTGFQSTDIIFNAELSKILQWQVMPNKQFVSYFAEGNGDSYNADGVNPGKDNETGQDSGDTTTAINNQIYADKKNADFHFYFFSQKNKRNGENGGQLEIMNLEFGGAPYIGVDFTGISDYTKRPNFWHNELVAVYLKNPDDADFDITEWYNPATEQFFPITQHFYLIDGECSPNIDSNIAAFRGDSFPAHAYIKTMTNPKYNPASRDDSYTGYINQGIGLCSYGQILGYAAEHTCNTGLRHPEDPALAKHVDELDYETFYPGLDPQTPYNYAHLNRGRESYRYNDGYSKQLSIAVSPGFDIQIPFREQHFQCRVVYSSKQTDESIIDNWRDIAEVNYKDFEGKSGALTRVVGEGGKLYTFYYSGVKMHPINELVQSVTNAGTVVLGQQNEILPDKPGSLSDSYGCQQTKALGVSDYFIYWFDYNKRAICTIQKGDGNVKVISVTEQINSLIYDNIEAYEQFSDVRYNLSNMPGYYEGVSVGYNRKYKEFYISYQRATPAVAPDAGTVHYKKTIIYSELLNKFTGTMDLFVPMFITINEDYYGFNPMAMAEMGNTGQPEFWLWDQEYDNAGQYNYQTFFGQLLPSWFEIVANKESSVPKAFDVIHIQMNDAPITSVELNTQYQYALMDPFNVPGVTPRYIMPKYRENKWEFSIKRADAVTSEYRIGSIMRGNHLRILVKFETNLPIFVKSLITGYRISLH